MRALRIGISVGIGHVRAVAVRSGRVVAATEAELALGDGVEEAVLEVLSSFSTGGYPRPRVTIALGPSCAQARRLTGLPPLDNRRILEQLVREGASKFFLRNGSSLLTTGVRIEAPGTVWAGALDEPTARAAEAGCRAAGLAVDAFVPSVVALARGLADGRHRWVDGSTAAEIEVTDGVLTGVRRLSVGPTEARELRAVGGLAELEGDGWRFADAYGAAILPTDEPLAVRRRSGGHPGGDVPPWRLAIAGIAAFAALTGAAVAPAWRAMQAGDAAAARLAQGHRSHAAAAAAQRELVRVTTALREIAAFDSARRSPLLVLESLTRALPKGSALIAVREDSAEGSAVVLAPRAASVLTALERVPGVGSAEIVGPVTREIAAGRQVERVTVRYRRTPSVVRAR